MAAGPALSAISTMAAAPGHSSEPHEPRQPLVRAIDFLFRFLAFNIAPTIIELALAADKPGSELESPMAVVILGGLITATFLNLVVVPALFVKWGRRPASTAGK